MANYNMQESESDQNEVIENIKKIDEEIQDEFDKGDNIDKDKVMKLRFKQLMQGLYLNESGMKNNR